MPAVLVALALLAAPGTFAPRDLEGMWIDQSATPLERRGGYAGLVATPNELGRRAAGRAAAAARGAKPQSSQPNGGGDDVGQGESEFGDRNDDLQVIDGGARTSIITEPADGRIPFTAEGKRLATEVEVDPPERLENPETRSASERCLLEASQAGPPLMSGPDNPLVQIVQAGDVVAIHSELIHQVRRVRIGGAHPATRLHPYQGDGVAHWDGDTLVIETIDQNAVGARRQTDASAYIIGPEARVTERLRRISPTEILYGFTVEDPRLYSRPWSGEEVLRKTDGRIFEFACHEGNYAMRNILAGAREAEKHLDAPER